MTKIDRNLDTFIGAFEDFNPSEHVHYKSEWCNSWLPFSPLCPSVYGANLFTAAFLQKLLENLL